MTTINYKFKVDRITIIVVTFLLVLAAVAITENMSGTDELREENKYLREKVTECINQSPHHMAESVFDDAEEIECPSPCITKTE